MHSDLTGHADQRGTGATPTRLTVARTLNGHRVAQGPRGGHNAGHAPLALPHLFGPAAMITASATERLTTVPHTWRQTIQSFLTEGQGTWRLVLIITNFGLAIRPLSPLFAAVGHA